MAASNGAGKHSYTVLVTGFGANHNAPYGNATSNPAGAVAGMMPASLSADHPLNSFGKDITILDGVKGGWSVILGELGTIRQTTKDLHEKYGGEVDLWIHLGRGPWEHVTCERRAFRQDFTSSWLTELDTQGYYLGRDNLKQNVNDLGPNPWTKVPMGLNSEVDIMRVVPVVNAALSKHAQQSGVKPLEVKSHLEAGAAGCGFIFYESMANAYQAGRKRDVIFLHLPRHEDQATLEGGRDAVLAIVGAAVASIASREAGEQNGGKNSGGVAEWKRRFGEEL